MLNKAGVDAPVIFLASCMRHVLNCEYEMSPLTAHLSHHIVIDDMRIEGYVIKDICRPISLPAQMIRNSW